MNNIQNSFKTYFSNQKSKQIKLNQFAKSNCVTTYGTTSSGRLKSTEFCYDLSEGSSGPIIIGVSLGAFTIILLLILLIKKNDNSSASVKSDSVNESSSLNEQISDSSLTELLEKVKKFYFPKLSIAHSFINGNYVILKDWSGNIISESNIKGNYLIVNDINGEVISYIKFKK